MPIHPPNYEEWFVDNSNGINRYYTTNRYLAISEFEKIKNKNGGSIDIAVDVVLKDQSKYTAYVECLPFYGNLYDIEQRVIGRDFFIILQCRRLYLFRSNKTTPLRSYEYIAVVPGSTRYELTYRDDPSYDTWIQGSYCTQSQQKALKIKENHKEAVISIWIEILDQYDHYKTVEVDISPEEIFKDDLLDVHRLIHARKLKLKPTMFYKPRKSDVLTRNIWYVVKTNNL